VAKNLAIGVPGVERPIATGISFELVSGDILGIVGPSGAGKSSLVRTLLGIWPPVSGDVRLDGATLDQWGHERLGAHVGYVPQIVNLFEGTVAENIARMEINPPAESVIAAAQAAGVHDVILKLPKGYDTRIGEINGPLSVGQRQRIALARALYGDPFLLILDEANANLDAIGETRFFEALKAARERGAIVVVITHRQSVLTLCTKILVLDEGRQKTYGAAADILRPQPVAQPLQAVR
jgi:ATP-binding cassette subfamily C protein